MKLLFLGDVFGKPGRQAVQRLVPRLISRHGLDLVVANAENAASGVGVTPELADELLAAEVDLLTSGNHIWSKREIVPYLDKPGSRLLRPANYPPGAPGRGRGVAVTPDGRRLGVINLEGRVFMKTLDDPFRVVLGRLPARWTDLLLKAFVNLYDLSRVHMRFFNCNPHFCHSLTQVYRLVSLRGVKKITGEAKC